MNGELCKGSRWAGNVGDASSWSQTRDQLIGFAHGSYGIFHSAEFALLLGVNLSDVPPGIGTRQTILAKYGLPLES